MQQTVKVDAGEDTETQVIERPVYTESDVTLTIQADQKVTGNWELDGGTKDGTTGSIDTAAKTIDLPFTNLEDGYHTLQFTGKNENGDADGRFSTSSTPISLDNTKQMYNLKISVQDEVGNSTEKEVSIYNDALGAIKDLRIYSSEKDITNQKLSEGSSYELSLMAVIDNGEGKEDSYVEINNPTLIEWDELSVEGDATLTQNDDGKMVLEVAEGSEGMVTARYLVNDAGAYPVSIAYGLTEDQKISLDSSKTSIQVADALYIGSEVTPTVKVLYDGALLTEDEDYTVEFKNNVQVADVADSDAPTVVIKGINGYTDGASSTFTISYLDVKDSGGNLIYSISGTEGYYTSDVGILPNTGYEISTKQTEGYQTTGVSVTEEGENTVDFYIKRISDGAITDKVTETILIDKTAPTGTVTLDSKYWNSLQTSINFGQYKVKDCRITITGADTVSGISDISYVISEEGYTSVSALLAAKPSWNTYSAVIKPEISVNKNQVIYAKLTDKAGNTSYISSEGILIDDTAPVVSDVAIKDDATLKDTSADITFTLSEAGTYYYAVLKKGVTAPDYETLKSQSIAGAAAVGTGNVIDTAAGTPVTLTVTGLDSNTEYILYAVAVDNTVELSSGESAGNTSTVVSSEVVKTKNGVPVITELPTVTGTYGTKAKDMTLTGGKAMFGDILVTGTFTYDGTEQKPEVTVSDSNCVIRASDYDIIYQDNINAGTAKVIIRGKGNYTGELETTFQIEKCPTNLTVQEGKTHYEVTEGTKEFSLSEMMEGIVGKLLYQSSNTKVATVSTDGIVQIVAPGTETTAGTQKEETTKKADKAESSKTGDYAHPEIYIIMIILAGTAIAAGITAGRRKRK